MQYLKGGNLQVVETATREMVELQLTNAEGFLRVLHVDDDYCFLKVSNKILEMEGKIKVETAISVDEAFEKLKQVDYDVVVSDFEMPGKNGLQFLEELRNIANSPRSYFSLGKNARRCGQSSEPWRVQVLEQAW
jgi:PleD family two-component response regulator